jgi:alkaline phosphatase D
MPWEAPRTSYAAPTISPLASDKPQLEQGIQIGDVLADRAVIWSRSDRSARFFVEHDVSDQFTNPVRVRGPYALDTSDYVARVDLTGLPSDSEIFVRVTFQDLSNDRLVSEPVLGSFRTAPVKRRDVRFVSGVESHRRRHAARVAGWRRYRCAGSSAF